MTTRRRCAAGLSFVLFTWTAVSSWPADLPGARACTNLLVTPGASADGSTIITYACDGEWHPHLHITPAADHQPGEVVEFKHGDSVTQVPEVPHTYRVVGLMNEHQLVIAESTFVGREELVNPQGGLHYWNLMQLALQRAKTAREAIQVMTDLVENHGYRSSGESFSIGDPKEAWVLEMVGPGPGGQGAYWVAQRVPDGMVSAHANKARISELKADDSDHFLASPGMVDFATQRGYYRNADGPFRFCDVFCPLTPDNRKYAETRVWSLFRRAAPSRKFSADFHRSVEGAKPYPWAIKPDRKLSTQDVFSLMRDHYEGTRFDMTKGVDAGPYGTPNRYRPISWEVDGQRYSWERPISTQQTGFSFVSQSRAWLPDGVGGVLWYSFDDMYTNCYVPLYACMDRVPPSYARGKMNHFSWDSAWWAFNFVSNYANIRYRDMVQDIQAVQSELEGNFFALQPAVEQTAASLSRDNPDLMRKYLTDYAVMHAEEVVRRWRVLGEELIRKYNDGYVQETPGRAIERGYPEDWLRRVITDRPKQFAVPEKDAETAESKLVD